MLSLISLAAIVKMTNDDSIATRASLLDRLKDREDQASWQEFFDTYWLLIYRVAKKAGLTDAEAQDIVQETVMAMANKLPGFIYDPKVCSFKTWMLRLTRWRIIDTLRKRLPQSAPAADSNGTATSALDRIPDESSLKLEAVWDDEWEKSLLTAALQRLKPLLKPEHYQIFDLYALRQLPVSQVAEIMGISAARVYLVKHRVAAKIRNEIKAIEATAS
ncbi:MAG: RNA polymerase subunit sigma [Verrucomicrobia bacterium]|nr:MAG: RNA polymerase subunit sigma [Verrucomicrobiota bacterium]